MKEDRVMMQTKTQVLSVLFLVLALFQAAPTLADDDRIQREIEAKIAQSSELRGVNIAVRVEQRLVVLTGRVRLYEQKLVSESIAWTTPGVFEVDNELWVVPIRALTDAAIDRRIREIIKADERFTAARVSVRVSDGEVYLEGRFTEFRHPSILKHKVAEIEGVVGIKIRATFLS